MKFATGKYALAICDRCGLQCPYKLLVADGQYPNLRVHASCRDEKHPAEKPFNASEGIALKNPRPNRDSDRPGEVLYVELDGVAGNYVSTPHSAGLAITGDIDIVVKAAPDSWMSANDHLNFIAKWDGSGGVGVSWYFSLRSSGKLRVQWIEPPNVTMGAESTVAIPLDPGTVKWVRAVLDVDDGAAGHAVTFYVSDDGVRWFQLGDVVTVAGTTAIDDVACDLTVGSRDHGVAGMFAGKVYYAEVRDGIGGTVVASFDLSETLAGSATVESPQTGETWTLHGDAELKRLRLADAMGFSNYFGGGT